MRMSAKEIAMPNYKEPEPYFDAPSNLTDKEEIPVLLYREQIAKDQAELRERIKASNSGKVFDATPIPQPVYQPVAPPVTPNHPPVMPEPPIFVDDIKRSKEEPWYKNNRRTTDRTVEMPRQMVDSIVNAPKPVVKQDDVMDKVVNELQSIHRYRVQNKILGGFEHTSSGKKMSQVDYILKHHKPTVNIEAIDRKVKEICNLSIEQTVQEKPKKKGWFRRK
jgi:hypothetical protein